MKLTFFIFFHLLLWIWSRYDTFGFVHFLFHINALSLELFTFLLLVDINYLRLANCLLVDHVLLFARMPIVFTCGELRRNKTKNRAPAWLTYIFAHVSTYVPVVHSFTMPFSFSTFTIICFRNKLEISKWNRFTMIQHQMLFIINSICL